MQASQSLGDFAFIAHAYEFASPLATLYSDTKGRLMERPVLAGGACAPGSTSTLRIERREREGKLHGNQLFPANGHVSIGQRIFWRELPSEQARERPGG